MSVLSRKRADAFYHMPHPLANVEYQSLQAYPASRDGAASATRSHRRPAAGSAIKKGSGK
ncbi:hypothetical protein [Chromobacterium vaccinii]|uniref:hypothetical protein n=1 Tax=Chromobacterium vaccinii TaxID=1108595 RepID=UPI000AC5A1B2|nr:hypothetical protein [Chromobacterium vaccinii]